MVDTKDGEVGMTKQEILDQFRDINHAYNNCNKLDTLSAMLDELLEAAQQWISVKDRLPESSGIKVIVSAKTTPESVLQTKAVFVAFLGYGDGKWYTPDVDFMTSAKTGNDNVHPVWEITHWMFPPEPPKEEEHG